jgi:hypothetical protein
MMNIPGRKRCIQSTKGGKTNKQTCKIAYLNGKQSNNNKRKNLSNSQILIHPNFEKKNIINTHKTK